jgi:hypothetical protein
MIVAEASDFRPRHYLLSLRPLKRGEVGFHRDDTTSRSCEMPMDVRRAFVPLW